MPMTCWERAGGAEKKLFGAISVLFGPRPELLNFLFDPGAPRLSAAPEELLNASRGLCSSDFLLVRVALDFWSGGGQVHLHEVVDADPEVYGAILAAMTRLAS